MILVGTQLNVSDNSGAKIIECIKILGKKASSFASIGDIIVVSIKEISGKGKNTRNTLRIEKGGVYKALILETKKGMKRKDGSILRFNRNTALLLSEQGNPIGTRVLGNVTYELRKKNQTKVLSLTSRVF